jgi:type III secretion protein R
MTEIQPSILALLAITVGLGLLAFAVVTTTAFIKVSVVLFLVRNALGTQSIPPNIVLYGAALILTVFISAPVFEQTYNRQGGTGAAACSFEEIHQ